MTMTEQEWLARQDPVIMLSLIKSFLPTSPGWKRKLQLFACACCWQHWDGISEEARRAVNVLELVTDGKLPEIAVLPHWVQLREGDSCHLARDVSSRFTGDERLQADWLRDIFGNPFKPLPGDSWLINEYVCERCGKIRYKKTGEGEHCCQGCGSEYLRKRRQRDLWLSPAVLALAKGIYEERRFEDLPIMADALEEAGCDNEDILQHCRGMEPNLSEDLHWRPPRDCCVSNEDLECLGCGVKLRLLKGCCALKPHPVVQGWRPIRGPHVRGCWLLDLLRGA